MNRIQELTGKSDPLLTEYAQGYGNDAYVGTELLPEVIVTAERFRVPEFGKENLRIYNTERALRAASNVLNPEGITTTEVSLKEHDLAFPMDYREAAASKELLRSLEQYAAKNVADAILLKQETITADLTQNPNNYPASNRVVLSGTSKWSNDSSKPIQDIMAAREAIRAASGRYPSKLLLGASSYNALVNHANFIERIKYSQSGVLTVELMQTILNIPKIVVGQAVSHDKTTNSFVDVWGDVAILAHVPTGVRAQRSPFVPSFGYTFRYNIFPMVDTYEENGGKVKYVRGTSFMEPYLLAPACGFLITDCV
jgi:hypothetical protein